MAKGKYLVVAGVPGIKKYVFGTDRLKEIRGASALLEDLTRNRIADYLHKCTQLETVTVFVGGGAGQFIIHAEEEAINASLKSIEGEFLLKTRGGALLNWGKAEYTGENYHSALKLAGLDAIQKLEENPFSPSSQLHTGFIRECDSCDGLVSAQPEKNLHDDLFLCDICRAKVEFNYRTRKTFFSDLLEYLRGKGISADPPDSFEQIGEQCQARKGYTALVYADGNAMGKFIRSIDTPELFSFFSQTVDDSIKKACHEALYEACYLEAGQHPAAIPAEILMLGGDDLLVYLTAETAFPFAAKVAEKFSAITREKMETVDEGTFFLNKLGGKGLTLSLGVAFGKSHTPFSILLDQAEELLGSAKKSGAKDPKSSGFYAPAYIDYHIASSYNQVHVADSRMNHLELPTRKDQKSIRLYQKPYSLKDAKALLGSAQALAASGISGTRLHRLGNAPSLGKMNGTLECLKLYTRTPKEKRSVIWKALEHFDCIGNMPWHEGDASETTMLVDLMELVAFCGKTNFKGEADAS
jgi:hypothetical protein